VETVLLADQDAIPGSISDFVWIFDAATGEVLSAALTGRFLKELDWGLFHSNAEAYVELDMVTQRVGGVTTPRRWLGQTLYGYCDDPAQRSCEIVSGRSYDSTSGYVYAVGAMQVHFGKLKLPTFSPLGEAVFAEIDTANGGIAAAIAPDESDRTTASAKSMAVANSQSGPARPAVSAGPTP
jgi:hypothetical protein